jgi:predicted amidophosphoribosyltransferase
MSGAAERPEPLGFGRCARCAYLKTGTPSICFACARRSIEGLKSRRCRVCARPFPDGSLECQNPICHWDDRYFEWNCAAAMRSGILERALNLYKYEHQRGWAQLFARVLVGFLNEERDLFRAFDLIVASPTYVGPDARQWDHTREVLTEARELDEGGHWPFDVEDPPAIEKIAATDRMMGKTWRERFELARGPLRDALRVSDPARTHGKQILVYDDVFTDGHTLNEVACCLHRHGGATRVCGVTLTRQPYGRETTR